MWGILGAIVMRFIFIFFSAAIIQQFEWILYVFGGFLVFSLLPAPLRARQARRLARPQARARPPRQARARHGQINPRRAPLPLPFLRRRKHARPPPPVTAGRRPSLFYGAFALKLPPVCGECGVDEPRGGGFVAAESRVRRDGQGLVAAF